MACWLLSCCFLPSDILCFLVGRHSGCANSCLKSTLRDTYAENMNLTRSDDVAGTNTYLIYPPNPQKHPNFLLLDTGQGSAFPAWSRSLQEVLTSESARLGHHLRITQCVLTHWHPDHVGGLNELRQLSAKDKGLGPQYGTGKEAGERLKIYKFPLFDSPSSSEIPHVFEDTNQTREREGQLLRSANDDEDVGAIHPLHDGQILQVGGAGDSNRSDPECLTLKVLHTPGHTADHIALLITSSPADPSEVGTIFTGDAVLGHGTAVFEDLGLYMESLKRMKEAIQNISTGQSNTAGENDSQAEKRRKVTALPAHGAVIPDAKNKIDEYIAHRAMREREVLNVLARTSEAQQGEVKNVDNGWTPMEIVKLVYKNVPESLHFAAQGGVVQVLAKLEGEGRVVPVQGDRWRIVLDPRHESTQEDKEVEKPKSAL
jgi:endoribonuclease LACTB2